jgi:hypothetical protein
VRINVFEKNLILGCNKFFSPLTISIDGRISLIEPSPPRKRQQKPKYLALVLRGEAPSPDSSFVRASAQDSAHFY